MNGRVEVSALASRDTHTHAHESSPYEVGLRMKASSVVPQWKEKSYFVEKYVHAKCVCTRLTNSL